MGGSTAILARGHSRRRPPRWRFSRGRHTSLARRFWQVPLALTDSVEEIRRLPRRWRLDATRSKVVEQWRPYVSDVSSAELDRRGGGELGHRRRRSEAGRSVRSCGGFLAKKPVPAEGHVCLTCARGQLNTAWVVYDLRGLN